MICGAALVYFITAEGGLPVSEKKIPLVELHEDYYVQPVLLEVRPTNAAGSAWDPYDTTGPDLFIQMFWQGQRIFESSTKKDSLLARWSNAEVDVRELALTGKKASVDDVIPAGRITVRENEQLELRIYDADLLGNDELIATVSIPTKELHMDEFTYYNPKNSVARLTIKVFPLDSIPDLPTK